MIQLLARGTGSLVTNKCILMEIVYFFKPLNLRVRKTPTILEGQEEELCERSGWGSLKLTLTLQVA